MRLIPYILVAVDAGRLFAGRDISDSILHKCYQINYYLMKYTFSALTTVSSTTAHASRQ